MSLTPDWQSHRLLSSADGNGLQHAGRGWHWLLAVTFLMLLVGHNIFRKPTLAALLLIYLPVALYQFRVLAVTLTRSIAMLALWSMLLASIFWSAVQAITVDLVFTQSAFIALALFVANRHKSEGFTFALRDAALIYVALVTTYCLVFPGAAFSSQGLTAFMPHKNTLGVMLGVCVLVFLHTPERNRWHLGAAILAMALLVLTRSKTAIVLVVFCSAAWPLAGWWSRTMYPNKPGLLIKDVLRLLLLFCVLTCLVLMVVFRDEVLSLMWQQLSKDALTGRGTLWLVVIQQLRVNSLAGLGPGVFWQADNASEIARTTLYAQDPNWVQHMVSADGSYMDIVAAIGMLGLALFLGTAVEVYRRLFRQWSQPDSRLMFVLVTFVLLQAVAESTLLYSTNILWLVYLVTYFRVAGRTAEPPTSQRTK